jgi:hypothetical protein
MKKLKLSQLLLASVFALSLLATGCSKKCVSCDCPATVELDPSSFCEDDFNSEEEYNLAVDLATGFGCTCVEE